QSSVQDPLVRQQVEIQAKYAGYIERQQTEIARAQRYETFNLPIAFDYQTVPGLSSEVIEKLNRHKPETLGQAGRIQGVTPAAISLLLVHLKKHAPSSEQA
ncbi:MAG: tRNA uridine-5-carboxymethylaminomethyl(34) synthesis enzyme MnmG, partial [Cycloclasticus sp.]